MQATLKERFLDAVIDGMLGDWDGQGVIVELKAFKRYFSDINSDYINSFLPAATIEPGRYQANHTKYLFRTRKGVYRIHPEVIKARQHQRNVQEGIRAPDQFDDLGNELKHWPVASQTYPG